jgi:hypothetical protein
MSKLLYVVALMIALVAMSAHAQTAPDRIAPNRSNVLTGQNTEVLPVWNNKSGKVEALLLLQPEQQSNGSGLFGAGASLNTGHGLLQADFSAESGNGLALLCNSNTGLVTLGSLAGRCLLTALDASQNPNDPFARTNNFEQSQTLRAEARFVRPESLFELSVGQADLNTTATDGLSPTSGLMPGMGILGGHVSQQDITARGQMSLGDNGWVSIGGTLARAQLIPTAGQGSSAESQRWNTTSVGVAVGRGKLSGEVIGRVVDVPGQSNTLSSLGIGVSWKTPWQGKLTFGAEKTTGANPLTPATKSSALQDEGTVPYVRYHQDL